MIDRPWAFAGGVRWWGPVGTWGVGVGVGKQSAEETIRRDSKLTSQS